MKKFFLLLEFSIIFVISPILVFFFPFYVPKIPLLLLVTLYVIFVLIKSKNFSKRHFWNKKPLKKYLAAIIIKSFVGIAAICTLTLILSPQTLFIFPKKKPFIFLLVLILYPILSAYPQEIIYRTFLFHRYKEIFNKSWMKITVSSLVFSLMHIVFKNWIAPILTLFGGLIFSITYKQTRSLLVVSIEHSIYGLILFTFGLGHYFYKGF